MKVIVLVITALFCVTAECEIYKVIDKESGKVTFTNTAPKQDVASSVEHISQQPINSIGGSGKISSEGHSSGSVNAGKAFEEHLDNVQISGSGKVKKLLPQDNDGSRHQKFILQLQSGQTLLVAHNIDLSPEIVGLSVGDTVEFFGEYEWNQKGGVLHWTHHDPDGSHIAGWLKHSGKTYQ